MPTPPRARSTECLGFRTGAFWGLGHPHAEGRWYTDSQVKPPSHDHPVQINHPLARSALEWTFARILRARLVIAPVLGSLALTFAFFEPTPWRKTVVRCGVAVIFSLSLVEFARYRKFGRKAVNLPFNVWLTVLIQLVFICATGGLFSPALPVILVMAFMASVLGESVTVVGVLAMALPAAWGFAFVHAYGWPVPSLLPAIYGGAQTLERGPAPWIAASLFTVMLSTASRVGLLLQKVFETLYADAVTARDRSLALHAEQSRTMTLLSSEIAHELKNPLASLKGLGGLIAKDVDGRTAERVKVLRGEIDRMQKILEEFLTFSRPLVPLSLAEGDLSDLARDVARLHEASANDASVTLDVDAPEPVVLRCDVRKLRQVLINLVQNALDASPAGGKVILRVARSHGRVSVSVLDEGAGLAPEVAERVFTPFVTSKEHGSGIGLVVARSLSRQHGGELELGPRQDGPGLRAELTLPLVPPIEPAMEAASPADGVQP